jgi:hypothetical protein
LVIREAGGNLNVTCYSERRLLVGAVLLSSFVISSVFLLSAEKKVYKPSEIQALRLQVKQKDAQLANQALAITQQRFNQAVTDFNAEVKTIEKENSWPDTLEVDPNTLEFKEAVEKK